MYVRACVKYAPLIPDTRRRIFFEQNLKFACVCINSVNFQFDKASSIVLGAQGKAYKYEEVKDTISELARTHEVYLVQPHGPSQDTAKVNGKQNTT